MSAAAVLLICQSVGCQSTGQSPSFGTAESATFKASSQFVEAQGANTQWQREGRPEAESDTRFKQVSFQEGPDRPTSSQDAQSGQRDPVARQNPTGQQDPVGQPIAQPKKVRSIEAGPSPETDRLMSEQAQDKANQNQTNDEEGDPNKNVDSDANPIAPDVSEDDVQPASTNPLNLEDVLDSVKNCYPEIEIAIGDIESANGKVLASWGEFDQIFSAHSISQPLSFYQNYRNGVAMTRPLYGGGEVFGSYRNGIGDFEPWFGERETNDGGEFKAGFSLPLLKNRVIDERRTELYSAGYQRDQVEANVDSRLLLFQRFATQAYWDWVAAGYLVRIQQRLLKLAETRVDQINDYIEAGDLAKITRIDNDRFIAGRRNSLIKARRELEKAAIKLSLFWRDQSCNPVIVDPSRIPDSFPDELRILDNQLAADIQTALSVRPELQELIAARKEIWVKLQYARNLTLPKVDLKGFASQDFGGEASPTGDKTPFELQLGVLAEVPIQRREGQGKIRAAEGKLTKIDAKTQLVTDKIRAEVQDAASAVNAAFDQIQQSEQNVNLTRESLELGRFAFLQGDISLLALNIYETDVAAAELQLLDAHLKYFFFKAVYETAIKNSF